MCNSLSLSVDCKLSVLIWHDAVVVVGYIVAVVNIHYVGIYCYPSVVVVVFFTPHLGNFKVFTS